MLSLKNIFQLQQIILNYTYNNLASSPPLIIVRIYNVQTCFECLSKTKQLLKASIFKNFGGNFLIFQQL